jgi:hypothetical protein
VRAFTVCFINVLSTFVSLVARFGILLLWFKFHQLFIILSLRSLSLNVLLAGDNQVQATDGDKDRPQNIVYFLTGQGVDPDNPENNKFAINRTTGEIYVLRVSCPC